MSTLKDNQEAINAWRLKKREFIPDEINLSDWGQIEPFFLDILARPVYTSEQLNEWLKNENELHCAIEEHYQWLEIKTRANSNDETAKRDFENFHNNIVLKLEEMEDKIDRNHC